MNNSYSLISGKAAVSKLLMCIALLFCFMGVTAQEWTSVGASSGISAGGASFNNMVKDNAGNLYVSYYDVAIQKASVQKFDGTAWTYAGTNAGITTGTATYSSLSADGNGNVYYTNQLGWPGSGMEVRKFDGAAWTQLPNMTNGSVNFQNSTVTPNGTLVAVSNEASGTVKRYVNGAWEQVGTTGFAGGLPYYVDIVAGSDNTVYISYVSGGNINVIQNSLDAAASTAWTHVGGVTGVAPATSSEQFRAALAIDSNNSIYVAYTSGGSGGNKLNVKKYNGTAWSQVGAENFSPYRVHYVNIAVSNNDVPYVVYSTFENAPNVKNTVMKFNGTAWENVGGTTVSDGEAKWNAIVFDNANNLYIGYTDSTAGKVVVKKFITNDAPPVAVESVTVATANNVPAEITAAAGTLQLEASVLPAEAGQGVTWEITAGGDFASIDENGLITAVANGTVTVTVTSLEDATKTAVITITISNQPCVSVSSLYENFDTLECCDMGVVPACWNSILLGGASQIISSTQPASGTSQIYQNGYGAGKISIVVLPHFSNVSEGTHQFRFKVKANSGPGQLEVGYITNIDDASTFTIIEALTINNPSYNDAGSERIVIVPATVPAEARLAVRNPGTTWAMMYWDDVYWEPITVTSVEITTQNDVPAEITTNGGTLQLEAAVNPVNVDQDVTWSIVFGNEFATIDANGLVTALGNGVVAVKATSVADPTKFDDIEFIISNQTAPVPCTFTTLELTGFNADVVAEGTGANANEKATHPIDGANAYYAKDFVPQAPHSSGASAAAYGGGLPNNGLIASTATTGLNYQMAAYNTNNALVLRNSVTNTGTLTLAEPKKAEKLYLAWVSAEGTNGVTVTVNFEDGTSQVFAAQNATDWWSATPNASTVALGTVGRVSVITTAGWAPVNSFSGLSETQVFQKEFELDAANFNKTIASLSFVKESSANNATTTAIFAASICETAAAPVQDVTAVEVSVENDADAVITVNEGTLQLVAVVTPEDATNTDVVWTITAGSEYATIDENGLVTAVANGTVTVRATSAEDESIFDEIEVVISNQTVAVTAIEVSVENDADAVITTANGTLQLVAVVTPADATNTDVVWTITVGSEYATIDENGLVTAVANGTVTVRATSGENAALYDEIEITIDVPTMGIDEFNKNAFTVYPNPVTDVVTITSAQAVKQVEVYNMMGQRVYTGQQNTVNLSNVQQGVYVVQVQFENGAAATQKLIKK